VPAALVMASTRAILRGVAFDYSTPNGQGAMPVEVTTPGEVLARANDLIVPDIPPKMFITCFYAILNPKTGELQYANAGHDVPYVRRGDRTIELRARGMPLGLLPEMEYEVKSLQLEPGDSILLYSDGLVEAHNPQREMFGFPRLNEYVSKHEGGAALIQSILEDLEIFTGPGWEQEDDVTLVTVQRTSSPSPLSGTERESEDAEREEKEAASGNEKVGGWRTLAAFEVPSEEGNEREVMRRVAEAARTLNLDSARIE